jgi:hypothetical protein
MDLQEGKKKVLAALSHEAQPIKVVAEKAGLSAVTVSKYCLVLEAEKKVEIRKFGNMKLIRRKNS